MEKLRSICEKVIAAGFYLLFLFVPLIFTPWTRELFEFPKMLLVYVITVVITAVSAIKSVINGKLTITKTPLDKPILTFLIIYLISTLFSIDKYTSIFGYYTRFNGGFLSVLCFITLFYILSSEIRNKKSEIRINKLIFCILFSSFLVSVWAILEHFGIDKDYWKQNVQARVFSTLGQPNWLAAYLVAIIPIPLSLLLSKNAKKLVASCRLSSAVTLYTAIWFTYSLSGLLGLFIALITFLILIPKSYFKKQLKLLTVLALTCFVISISSPGLFLPRIKEVLKISQFPQAVAQETVETTSQSIVPKALELGGRTGRVRLIVWKGTIDLIFSDLKTALIGTGPETFAYAFLPYRPKELNQTIEWDFLYNKAHNEFLNLGACIGLLGLGSYLWFIGGFIFWTVRRLKREKNTLVAGVFSGWVSLLVTSFFGFQVVATSLLFWLYPAIAFSLTEKSTENP